jgi:hypothetical protein
MGRRTLFVVGPTVLAFVAGAFASSDQPSDQPSGQSAPTPEAPDRLDAEPEDSEWRIRRVGGDLTARVATREGLHSFGPCRIESPLPADYPMPTPPGAIELKRYPTVRRAEVSGESNPDSGTSRGFWPLFQHIKKRDIAMTSPVEVEYRDWSTEEKAGAWTMSFLYRTADLGPTGRDGIVTVTDTEPVTVIAIGLRGGYGVDRIAKGIEQLQTWLASQNEWEAAGNPRAFYYNGPYIPNRNKWAEAQIPVRENLTPSSIDDAADTS